MKEMKQFEIKIIFSVIIVVILAGLSLNLTSCKVQDTMMVPAGTYVEKGHWISDKEPISWKRTYCKDYE